MTLILAPGIGLLAWAHYAPLLGDSFRKTYRRLLRWNDELPFVKFAISEDERIMLTAELPAAALDRDAVGRTLARLVAVCDLLYEESASFLGDWAQRRRERTDQPPGAIRRRRRRARGARSDRRHRGHGGGDRAGRSRRHERGASRIGDGGRIRRGAGAMTDPGRRVRRPLLVVGTSLVVLVAWLAPGGAPPVRAVEGVVASGATTLTVQPDKHRVHARVDLRIRNDRPSTTSGGVTTDWLVQEWAIAVPDEAVDVRVTRAGKRQPTTIRERDGYDHVTFDAAAGRALRPDR